MSKFIHNQKRTGKRIKKYRNRIGLTETGLASAIGKTESSVRKYEAGLTNIPLSVICDIANALQINQKKLVKFEITEEAECE